MFSGVGLANAASNIRSVGSLRCGSSSSRHSRRSASSPFACVITLEPSSSIVSPFRDPAMRPVRCCSVASSRRTRIDVTLASSHDGRSMTGPATSCRMCASAFLRTALIAATGCAAATSVSRSALARITACSSAGSRYDLTLDAMLLTTAPASLTRAMTVTTATRSARPSGSENGISYVSGCSPTSTSTHLRARAQYFWPAETCSIGSSVASEHHLDNARHDRRRLSPPLEATEHPGRRFDLPVSDNRREVINHDPSSPSSIRRTCCELTARRREADSGRGSPPVGPVPAAIQRRTDGFACAPRLSSLAPVRAPHRS